MSEGTILVVEDNVENSMIVEKTMKRKGYEVVVVEEGEKALQYCKDNTPDIILMDVNLGDMDGFEITTQLRQYPNIASIPIVLATAYDIGGLREKFDAAGLTDYLMKPYMPMDIVNAVKRNL